MVERFFGRVVCVNLDRSPDRWKEFLRDLPVDWPFGEVERFAAIDGQKCPPPHWFRGGASAWGCNQSHRALIEDALNRGLESILLLEDDAICRANFLKRWESFVAELPDDWDLLYLGGQHIVQNRMIERISRQVYRPYNVNRTHAWALRPAGMRAVYQRLWCDYAEPAGTPTDVGRRHIIDNHLAALLEEGSLKVYCPARWLFGQREGKSEIAGRQLNERWWNDAVEIQPLDRPKASVRAVPPPRPEPTGGRIRYYLPTRRQADKFGPKGPVLPDLSRPFVPVIGVHSSGSSALAGVLWHLGLHLGNRLVGYYGTRPGKECGYEAAGLVTLCNRFVHWPATGPPLPERAEHAQLELQRWIADRQNEAAGLGTLAGGKYPILCAMGEMLDQICGNNLLPIHAERPLEESIESFVRRERRRKPANQLRRHQEWLWDEKQETLARWTRYLTIEYRELLEDPRGQIGRIVEYLSINPSDGQIAAAVGSVDPRKRHVVITGVMQ